MTTATADQPSPLSALRARLPALHRCGETAALTALLPLVSLPDAARQQVSEHARQLITGIRARQPERSAVAALLHEYALSSTEGVALMCLAEALLRIPDDATVDRLIHDKLGSIDWSQHIPHNDQLFINAANWALMLTGRLIHLENHDITLAGATRNLLSRASDPLIRQAMRAAMRLLGTQFIMGRNIEEARQRAHADETQGWRHSYDMLGEAALGQADAQRYRSAYLTAITALGTPAHVTTHPIPLAPGISIKLSALHPRYEALQRPRVMAELLPVVRELALAAKTQGIGLTLDAEESDRLELSLDIFEALAFEPLLAGWDGLGLAVQAYQKRAPAVLDWLAELARCSHRRLMVRLVKGAYWDSEIKLAQERGLTDYPVHTRKAATDLAWLACAAKLLDDPTAFYPQFATHNALSVAHVLMLAKQRGLPASAFEFQCLHGMGRALYEQLIAHHPVRIYAPVGNHADLLAYLVRRLLENGANTSFVHQLENGQTPIAQLLIDPLTLWHAPDQPTPIPRPEALYLQHTPHQHQHNMPRKNSAGLDLQDTATQQLLAQTLTHTRQTCYRAAPTTTQETRQDGQDIRSPANCQDLIGEVFPTRPGDLEQALQQTAQAARPWQATPVHQRAGYLERAAELFEQHAPELISLIVREGGRTLIDAASEVREAIDFCRYYAASARADFAQPRSLPGPTGESNQLSLHGRGVFACISPWNFPLAIFTGQVAAALAAGNTVIAKPAEQTPLTAAAALRLLHAAGIPQEVLHLLPGDGTTGAALVADPRIDGVAFTGSSATAQRIQHSLAARNTAAAGIVPLIAETGGLNVMIADSSALPEQLVRDVLSSAFNSAGQRCSALRVLFVQDDIAERVLSLLTQAMNELIIGDPSCSDTDLGPLIDSTALTSLQAHQHWLEQHARLIHRCPLPETLASKGHYFPPQVWEIERLDQLSAEVFGPVLHILRWSAGQLDDVLAAIDASGYGLTLGIHSRIDATIAHIAARARVGNLYVNRNMIGATVGVQPFGGERRSGTGPKAGGPHYLLRFAVERCLTINTAAVGGNASLMAASPTDKPAHQ